MGKIQPTHIFICNPVRKLQRVGYMIFGFASAILFLMYDLHLIEVQRVENGKRLYCNAF